ncbi:MAG: hypothetical protein HYX48_04925 [Chlamydiales bacterium]|nr:hypothetical protein [Chlamydiales bacterium]
MSVKAVSKPITSESKGERAAPTAFARLPDSIIEMISIFACGRENQSSTFEREYRLLRRVSRCFRDALNDEHLSNCKLELYIRRTFPSLHGDRALYAAAQTNMLAVLESREFCAVEKAVFSADGTPRYAGHPCYIGDEDFCAARTSGWSHNTTSGWSVLGFCNEESRFDFSSSCFFDNKTQILDRRLIETDGKNLHWIRVRDLALSESQGRTLGKITRDARETFAVSDFFLAYGNFKWGFNVVGLCSGTTKKFGELDPECSMEGSSIYEHRLFLNLCGGYDSSKFRYTRRFTRVVDLSSDPKVMRSTIIPQTQCGNMLRVKEGMLMRATLFDSDGNATKEVLQILDASFNLIRNLTIHPRDELGNHWNSRNGSNLRLVGERALVLGSKAVSLYSLDKGERVEIFVAAEGDSFADFQIFDGILRIYRSKPTAGREVRTPIDIKLNLTASERESIRKAQQQALLEKEEKLSASERESMRRAQQRALLEKEQKEAESRRQASPIERKETPARSLEPAADQPVARLPAAPSEPLPALPALETAAPASPPRLPLASNVSLPALDLPPARSAPINSQPQPPAAPPTPPAQPLPAPQQSFWDSALECLTTLFNWIRDLLGG